jgi:hypothetical protein
MVLVAGTVTSIGPLYEAWNLWQVEDPGHLERALGAIAHDTPEVRTALADLDATVEHEHIRILRSLPFAELESR